MTAAIVFDMDGVLADTERLKLRAHRSAVEAAGGTLERSLYRARMGGTHEDVIRAFLSASGLADDGDAVGRYRERFRNAYRRLLASDLEAMPGAREVLTGCRSDGRPLALVTSSEAWMARIVLERLDAADAFRAVITAADVIREKPHPEPYRRARRVLDPELAVAVEDTRSGVSSATAAGLPVIAVRHALNRDHPFEEAAAVLESLDPAERFFEVVDEVAERRHGAGGRAPPRRPG